MRIELLTSRTAQDRLGDLIELLLDAVDSGASIGFLPPLSRESASDYWCSVFADLDAGHRLLLGAMDGSRLVGSVQLELARKPNASHRAEVQRLLVLRSVRRRGTGERLMRQLHELARQHSRTLLVLAPRPTMRTRTLQSRKHGMRRTVQTAGDGLTLTTAVAMLTPPPPSRQ